MNKSKGKIRRRIWRKRLHKAWKQSPHRWRRTPPLIFNNLTEEEVRALARISVQPFPILDNKPIKDAFNEADRNIFVSLTEDAEAKALLARDCPCNDAGDMFDPPEHEQRDGDPIAMQCREHGTWYIDPLEILEPHRCPQCEVQDHAPKDAK